jgi:hypothetical protein
MTVGTASDQCPVPTPQVSVRFNQPSEFVAELQARGPNLEPLVRLTLVGRRGQLRDGTPLPVQELSVHASYLRRTGKVVQLVTLETFVGEWWGITEQNARTQERVDQVLELVRGAAVAASLEVAAGRYVATSNR